MQAYNYEAINPKGKLIRGTIMADSARSARADLKIKKLMPIKMDIAGNIKTSHSKKVASMGKVESTGKINRRALTQVTRQLAILIKAGTPVAEALKVTAFEFEKGSIRARLLDVRAKVLEGHTLSQAMASAPKTFSSLYTSMVAAGESSGQLYMVLNRLASDREAEQKVRNKILGATIYPIILSIVALGVIIILMTFVVPKVVEQFESFHQELPPLTKLTIGFSEWLQAYGLWGGLVLFISSIVFLQAMKTKKFRRPIDKAVLKLPFIGRLNRDMNAARFSRTMSGLLDSSTPALQALRTSRNTVKNIIMSEAIDHVIEQVKGGSSIGKALKQKPVFPPLMVHMVTSGEASGDLGEMFKISADYLESEFDSATTIVLNLLEPLIIIFLGGVVLIIVAAIFLPILRLNTLSF